MNNNKENYYRIEPENYRKGQFDIIITPKKPPIVTLIFLHGLGDSPLGYVDFFTGPHSPLEKDSKVILLCAPELEVTCFNNYKCRRWFDVKNRSLEKPSDYDRLNAFSNFPAITQRIEEESSFYNNDNSRIILRGFGQGACIALSFYLMVNSNFGGVIALSGSLFHNVNLNILELKKKLNIFIGHGAKDSIIPLEIAEQSYQPIKPYSQYHIYPNMSHAISNEELKDVADFIQYCIRNK